MKDVILGLKNKTLFEVTLELFEEIGIELNQLSSESVKVSDIFTNTNPPTEEIQSIYAVGLIDDDFLKDENSNFEISNKQKYDGILVFAVELNNSNPTRKILSDISRAFNREYYYTPVIILFKYGNKLSLSNTQRQPYKIEKEGEKVGKVTILRDIDINNPHSGHIKILEEMKIRPHISTYEELYSRH